MKQINQAKATLIFESVKDKIRNLSLSDLISLLALFFITITAYLLLHRKVEYVEIVIRLFNQESPEYAIGSNRPKVWYVEHIKPGKKQTNSFGQSLIEITDVYTYPGPATYQDAYVTLKLRATKNRSTNQYIYNGSPLLIHDIRSFQVQDILLSGEIIDLTTKPREKKAFLVEFELTSPQGFDQNIDNNSQVIIRGVSNHIAQVLEEGMVIKDSLDEEMVRIVEIKKQPGLRSYVSEGRVVEVVDPRLTQVSMTLEIVGERINNSFYYRKEAPLIVNQQIHLIFNDIAFSGVITSVNSDI